MFARALRDLQCSQPLLAVTAARACACSMKNVAPDALAQCLLAQNSLHARTVLFDDVGSMLIAGSYHGGDGSKAQELMISIARECKNASGGEEELARLAGCALIGSVKDEKFCKGFSHALNKNWLLSLLRRGEESDTDWSKKFWASFSAEVGQGSLIMCLKKAKMDIVSPEGCRYLWNMLWNVAKDGFGDSAAKESAFYFAMRVVKMVSGSKVLKEAVKDVLGLLKNGKNTIPCAVRLLLALVELIGCDKATLIDPALMLLCRCIEENNMHEVRDVLSLIPEKPEMLTGVQKYELALLCSFLLFATGGALGSDVMSALKVAVSDLHCKYVAELVQCSLISFLFSSQQSENPDVSKVAENLLVQIQERIKTDSSKGNCVCRSEQSFSNSDIIQQQLNAPLALSLMSIARNLCSIVEYSNDKDYISWLNSIASKLAGISSFQPMLLFFMLPVLLPSRSSMLLDEGITVMGGAIAKHGEQAFGMIPFFLNLLASDTVTSNSLLITSIHFFVVV